MTLRKIGAIAIAIYVLDWLAFLTGYYVLVATGHGHDATAPDWLVALFVVALFPFACGIVAALVWGGVVLVQVLTDDE